MVNHMMSKKEHATLINQGQQFIDLLALWKDFTGISTNINDYLQTNNHQTITFDFQYILMVEPIIQIEYSNDIFICKITHKLPDAHVKDIEFRTEYIDTLLFYLKLYFNKTTNEECEEYE